MTTDLTNIRKLIHQTTSRPQEPPNNMKIKATHWIQQHPPSFIITLLIIISWSAVTTSLMIADVWDETNAMLLFEQWNKQQSFYQTIVNIWSLQTANLYRPLPVTIFFTIYSLIPTPELSWHILRGFNSILLIIIFYLLISISRYFSSRNTVREILLALAFFGSSSVMISASWFANIFDIMALLFILFGINLLLKNHYKLSLLFLSLSFFCKEISVLLFPVLLMLYWTKTIEKKKAIKLLTTLSLSFLAYIIIRQSVVPIGSSEDIHGFNFSQLVPTAHAWFESLWWQHTRREAGVFGILCSLAFIVSLKNIKAILISMGIITSCIPIYLSMLPYDNTQAISHLVFQGRLYLIPTVLLLLIAAIWGRTASYFFILIPVLLGSLSTYQDYKRFQSVYRSIYDIAEESDKDIYIHYPHSPLKDLRRGVMIGNYPDALYKIDTSQGTLIKLTSSPIKKAP